MSTTFMQVVIALLWTEKLVINVGRTADGATGNATWQLKIDELWQMKKQLQLPLSKIQLRFFLLVDP